MAAVICGATLCSTACTTAATTAGSSGSITPGTDFAVGLIVRGPELWRSVGCGTGPTQVSKYIAVVATPDGNDLDGLIYDCFADAQFVSQPISSVATYTVRVFGFSQPEYDARTDEILRAQFSRATALAARPSYVSTCDSVLYTTDAIAVCQPPTKL